MSDLPPIPDIEFSEQWHTYLSDLRDCVEDINKRTSDLENVEEEEEELPNQVIQGAVFFAEEGDTAGTATGYSLIDNADGEVDIVNTTVQSQEGNKFTVLANLHAFETLTSGTIDVTAILYIDGTAVHTINTALGNASFPTQHRLSFAGNMGDSVAIRFTLQAASGTNVEYNHEGKTFVQFLEIRE